MQPVLLLFLLTVSASPEPPVAPVGDSGAVYEETPSEQVGGAQDAIESLKNDMLGLEHYLQDKKDYKEFCPHLEWAQPLLEEYKEDPRSYLPETCKKKE